MQRFFVHPFVIKKGLLELKGPLSHQINNVLRAVPGDTFVFLDNAGNEYDAVLKKACKENVLLEIKSCRQVTGEPEIKINLYLSLLKKDKFELVLQKCTEIGVSVFIPVVSQHCIPLFSYSTGKHERWKSILREAAEQSKRGLIPQLEPVVPFSEACRRVKGFSLILWEGEVKNSLYAGLRNCLKSENNDINIFVGPEGGFTKEEIEMARINGIRPVGLGSRVLRSETAAMVATANILYHFTEV